MAALGRLVKYVRITRRETQLAESRGAIFLTRETKAKEEWMEGKGETERRTDSGMLPKDQTGKAVG